MLVLLIMATIVDAALAILLVAVSGFIFGGPEGVNGEPTAVALWVVALAGCFAAPAAGEGPPRRGPSPAQDVI